MTSTALALASVDTFRNQIICCKAETLLKSLPTASVDVVITSPPYNLRNSTGGGVSNGGKWTPQLSINGYGLHDDNMPHEQYVAWQREILTECMRVIKPDGAIFYNHKWRVQAGLLQDRRDITDGFPVRQIIIWQRNGGMNFNEGYFLPTYEVIYVITKPKFKLRLGHGLSDVWYIPVESRTEHPAPFPLELPSRIIRALRPGRKVILDPFGGSGTTALAAQSAGHDYILSELNPDYVEMANRRLAKPRMISMFTALQSKPAPKVEQHTLFAQA